MGKKMITFVTHMPNSSCPACHGVGAVRMTAHFHSGDREFEAPCWECFGTDVKVSFPSPRTTDNA